MSGSSCRLQNDLAIQPGYPFYQQFGHPGNRAATVLGWPDQCLHWGSHLLTHPFPFSEHAVIKILLRP